MFYNSCCKTNSFAPLDSSAAASFRSQIVSCSSKGPSSPSSPSSSVATLVVLPWILLLLVSTPLLVIATSPCSEYKSWSWGGLESTHSSPEKPRGLYWSKWFPYARRLVCTTTTTELSGLQLWVLCRHCRGIALKVRVLWIKEWNRMADAVRISRNIK